MFALASDVTLRDDSLKEYVSSGFIRQAGVACSLVGLACQSTPHVLREKKKKKTQSGYTRDTNPSLSMTVYFGPS